MKNLQLGGTSLMGQLYQQHLTPFEGLGVMKAFQECRSASSSTADFLLLLLKVTDRTTKVIVVYNPAATFYFPSCSSQRSEIPLNFGRNGDMGYSVFLEALLEMALSLFPLFEGSSEGDPDMKRSQNDTAEIYSVPFTWKKPTGTYN